MMCLSAAICCLVAMSFFVWRLNILAKFRQKQDEAELTAPEGGQAWNYAIMKELIQKNNIRMPAMFVDLDVFDRNTKTIVGIVKKSGKTLRIATKSIRCPYLTKRITTLGKAIVKGFMCYSVEEVALLAEEGLDDFYVAYPTIQRCDLNLVLNLVQNGTKVTLTIDDVKNANKMDMIFAEEQIKLGGASIKRIGVCVDLDLSCKLLGGLIHLGAHRSRVDSIAKFAEIVRSVQDSRHMKLVGVMGYEAQVAGLPDDNPFAPLPNFLIRFMKRKFFASTLKFRSDIASYCQKCGITLDFYNGGGSGNIREACTDSVISEVAAGSAFLQAQLFDYYVHNECSPAIAFALQATRVNENYIVCQSGGFIASGSACHDKSPRPMNDTNPWKLEPYSDEGFGEVQTPLRIVKRNKHVNETIDLADPVFFRPAKSGEIGEHFLEYYLIQNAEIVGRVKTYRGLGELFF